MKKILVMLAVILCCTIISTVFTSCGGDDYNNSKNDTTPAAAVITYTLTSSKEMRDTFDLTIEYYDAEGKVQTEKMTGDTWTKEVTSKLPATLGAHMKVQLNDGVDVSTVETLPVCYGYDYNARVVDATGKFVIGNIIRNQRPKYRLNTDRVSSFLETYSSGLANHIFVFDEKGKLTENHWQ